MLHFLLFGLALALIPLLIINRVAAYERRRESFSVHYGPLWWGAIKIVSAALAVLWLSTPFYYEFSGWPDSVPVSFTPDEKMVKHPWGMFTTGLNGQYSNSPHPTDLALVTPTVTLVTENPKVRTLQHDISVVLTNAEIFFAADPRRRSRWWVYSDESIDKLPPRTRFYEPGLNRVLRVMWKSELYNFNNAHSRELGQLFNPLDSAQQAEYRRLLEQFLGPVLKSNGLAIVSTKFSFQ
jgi:hypothetical protein